MKRATLRQLQQAHLLAQLLLHQAQMQLQLQLQNHQQQQQVRWEGL
jgi:hypothetical protein